jgi:hypothetical protein
MILETEER